MVLLGDRTSTTNSGEPIRYSSSPVAASRLTETPVLPTQCDLPAAPGALETPQQKATLCVRPLQLFVLHDSQWRKLVGVEPTHDTKYRTTGLKPAPSTGQD
jgi:hypothetical protein